MCALVIHSMTCLKTRPFLLVTVLRKLCMVLLAKLAQQCACMHEAISSEVTSHMFCSLARLLVSCAFLYMHIQCVTLAQRVAARTM